MKDPGEQQGGPKRPENRLHLAGALIVTKTLECAVLGNLLMGAFLLFPENEEARWWQWLETIGTWMLHGTGAVSIAGLVGLGVVMIRPGVANVPWTCTLGASVALAYGGLAIW